MRLRRPAINKTSRRRPDASQPGQNFTYYTQSAVRETEAAPRARRQPLPRSKREILTFFGQRFGLLVAIVAGVALCVSSLQVSYQPRIVIINSSAVYRLHPDSTYRTALADLLKTSWTNTNKITIDTAHDAQQLRQEFPELADVSIALPLLGQRPVAYLQLTEPRLILVTTTSRALVLDENGRVLAPTSQVAKLDSFNLPTITDQSGLNPTNGQLALNTETVSFIRGITHELHAAGVSYGQLVLPPASQELDVYLSGKPYFVKFNTHTSGSVRQQAGTFLAVQRYLDSRGVTPSSYIDARVAGRAYYK